MIKALIGGFVALLIVVIGLTIYLGPNDLASCESMPTEKKGCGTADAIVAISGGDTAARTREAVQLYNDGWAPKLIFSGAAQDKSGPSNAAAMRHEAQALGVPFKDIIIEEYGETTKQNAENTQTILRDNGVNSVILVTSAYHQRRAWLEFSVRSGGVTVRNHPVERDDQWSAWWWATPIGWFLAVGEFVKIIAFYFGGTR